MTSATEEEQPNDTNHGDCAESFLQRISSELGAAGSHHKNREDVEIMNDGAHIFGEHKYAITYLEKAFRYAFAFEKHLCTKKMTKIYLFA